MIENKKYFLLDMDGTLYLGNQLIEGAKEFLEKIKLKNKKYIFMTNNSSKNREAYVEKLKKLGIDANVEEIFGSTEATIIYLNKIKKGAKIFLLGNELLEEAFLKAGFEIIKEKDKEIDFVVLGFDTTLTYDKIWKACDYIFAGIPYIATHPDFVCPLDGGKCMPDTGSMIEMIKAVTGKTPLIIGKPNKHIIDGIIEKYNISKEETVIVGDRLYTDIRTGLDNGITSVLVMSGETTEETLKETIYKPDYIFNSVKDMIDII